MQTVSRWLVLPPSRTHSGYDSRALTMWSSNSHARRPQLLWIAMTLAILLGATACTDPNRNPEPERTPQAESSDWRRPGLVDQHGEAVEVERPEASRGTSLDVTEFGADPAADSGDDAAAIRDAIAAADPGDEVVLPPGTYDLQSTHPNDDSANLLLRS